MWRLTSTWRDLGRPGSSPAPAGFPLPLPWEAPLLPALFPGTGAAALALIPSLRLGDGTMPPGQGACPSDASSLLPPRLAPTAIAGAQGAAAGWMLPDAAGSFWAPSPSSAAAAG